MKKFLVTGMMVLVALMAYAQKDFSKFIKDMTEGPLQIRQRPNSEKLLSSLLSGIDSKSDTLYAVLYRPTYCRRCETILPKFDKQIKQVHPLAETLLIAIYPLHHGVEV